MNQKSDKIFSGLLIRLDDIAANMNWTLMEKAENLFDKFSVKPILGVIPNNQDKQLLVYEKKGDFWKKVYNWQKKGWEISMHGSDHVYLKDSQKKDFFNYGGKSEFWDQPLEIQKKKIKDGLKIFKEHHIKCRSFFAPNHSYDHNTFEALKSCGINEVIDGYGLFPYISEDIKFIPQLFYKLINLPIGIQTTQIHLNYWNDNDFENFEKFLEKNKESIITYDQAISNIKYNFTNKLSRNFLKNALYSIRLIKSINKS